MIAKLTMKLSAGLFLFSVFLFPGILRSDDLVRVYTGKNKENLKRVLATGYRTVLHRRGRFIDVVVPTGRLAELAPGCKNKVLQRSMDKYVRNLSHRPDWGGYHTFQELQTKLEDFERRYPKRVQVNTVAYGWDTKRGLAHRPIYEVRIGSKSSDKPAILLFAGIHAREIATTDVTLMFLEDLLQQAEKNASLASLLDRVAIHAIPCLNPDGRELVFKGNIWWRKNCRPGDDGRIVGVDLNRNFAHHFGANYPRGGSSSRPGSETYRGPSAFSEPESRAIKRVVQENPQIVASMALHSYGGFLLVPMGYNGTWPAHEKLYKRVASEITKGLDWPVGTVRELLGYYSNGRHDDWLYGSKKTGKDRILAFQLEIGNTFFTESRLLPTLSRKVSPVILRLLKHVSQPPELVFQKGESVYGRPVPGLVTVRNKAPGILKKLSVNLLSPMGQNYKVCSLIELSGSLRGKGSSVLRRIVYLPPEDAQGPFTLTVNWAGGGRVRKTFDLGAAQRRQTVLED